MCSYKSVFNYRYHSKILIKGGGSRGRIKPLQIGFIDLASWSEYVAIACWAKFQLYEPFGRDHIYMVKIGTDNYFLNNVLQLVFIIETG
jgi:hypothetical protein